MNDETVLYIFVIALVIGLGTSFYVHINTVDRICPGYFLNLTYRTETKAFDVSDTERCDFLLEYDRCELISVTKTFCIGVLE